MPHDGSDASEGALPLTFVGKTGGERESTCVKWTALRLRTTQKFKSVPTPNSIRGPAHWCHPVPKPLCFDYMGIPHPTYSLCNIFNLVVDAFFLSKSFSG